MAASRSLRSGTSIDEKVLGQIKDSKVAQVRIRPVVTDEIVYLDADEEEKFYIAQANAPLDEGTTVQSRTACSSATRTSSSSGQRGRLDYMDVSPKPDRERGATAMIPFLEHDDATGA
jgi:DNA-directed RNA polymerase subunit beta